MNHEEPDRVPLYSFSVDAKFIKAFGDGNALKTYEVMGLDSFPIRAQNWCQGNGLSNNGHPGGKSDGRRGLWGMGRNR